MFATLEDKSYTNMTIPSDMAVGKPIIGAIISSCNNFIRNNKVDIALTQEIIFLYQTLLTL